MNISALFLLTASAWANDGLVMDCDVLLERRTREQVTLLFVSGCHAEMKSVFGASRNIVMVSKELLSTSTMRCMMDGQTSTVRALQNSFSVRTMQIVVQPSCTKWFYRVRRRSHGSYRLSSSYCFDRKLHQYRAAASIPTDDIRLHRRTIQFGNRTSFRLEKYYSQGIFATRLLVSVTNIVHFTLYPDRALPHDLFAKPFSSEVWLVAASCKVIIISLLWLVNGREIRNHILEILCASLTSVQLPKIDRFLLNIIMSFTILVSTIPTTVYKSALTSVVNKPPLNVAIRSEEDLTRTDEVVAIAGHNMTLQYKTALHSRVSSTMLNFDDIDHIVSDLNDSKIFAATDRLLRMLETTYLAHVKIFRLERSKVTQLVEYVAIQPDTIDDVTNLRPWAMRIFECRLFRFYPLAKARNHRRSKFTPRNDPRSLKFGLLKPLLISYSGLNLMSFVIFLLTFCLNPRRKTRWGNERPS